MTMILDHMNKADAQRVAELARWAYARAALVTTEVNVQRRLAWSALVGALIGFRVTEANELLPDPVDAPAPSTIDDLMKALSLALANAFIDGPPAHMLASPDSAEAWEEVLSRFIINSVRANVVILDRGKYDALVKNQRKG